MAAILHLAGFWIQIPVFALVVVFVILTKRKLQAGQQRRAIDGHS